MQGAFLKEDEPLLVTTWFAHDHCPSYLLFPPAPNPYTFLHHYLESQLLESHGLWLP